ncbi:MAG: zinc-dependent peptidase [Planctomycetes bacterium]|nr:zinc-dependent peptidase [Planctomycetota bacterium]
MTSVWILLAAGILAAALLWRRAARAARLARIAAQPFPPVWEAILERNVALYPRLPEPLRAGLRRRILVFLATKRFEGCGGLAITDEIRLTIASQACMLCVAREEPCFPALRSIFVYPRGYRVKERRRTGPFVAESPEVRAGESWRRGPVVLAWDETRRDARALEDGHNVVLHEFAHQIDAEDGDVDGAPPLDRASAYRAWARILGAEYRHLIRDIERGRPSDIDAYGATNPAEFFAVATEAFFESPHRLRSRHPDLYEELKACYGLDPAEWGSAPGIDPSPTRG